MTDQSEDAAPCGVSGVQVTDALTMVRDLGRDSRAMASALLDKLDELTTEAESSTRPEVRRAIAGVRDLAEELRAFLSWVDEDPVHLLSELRTIAADTRTSAPAGPEGHQSPR